MSITHLELYSLLRIVQLRQSSVTCVTPRKRPHSNQEAAHLLIQKTETLYEQNPAGFAVIYDRCKTYLN
jgi:hypothetical protein